MKKILIVGATSAIAEAVARRYAAQGARIFLVGRNIERLEMIAADLQIRGAQQADCHALDVNELTKHCNVLNAAWDALGGVDVALIAHGTLPDQTACDASIELALREFTTNATATIALCSALAARLETGSSLAVISSVAGDRGRASNFLYGSAKAAVSAYLSGLGQKLHGSGINVLTIKPGFVDTPMTAAFKKGPLWATPEKVALGITSAIDRRRSVAYLPAFWWAIMFVIKAVPETVFRRIKL